MVGILVMKVKSLRSRLLGAIVKFLTVEIFGGSLCLEGFLSVPSFAHFGFKASWFVCQSGYFWELYLVWMVQATDQTVHVTKIYG